MKRLLSSPSLLLTASFDTSSDEEAEAAEEEDFADLSPSQKRALRSVLRGHNTLIVGGAGTGKSFLIARIRSALNRRAHPLAVCATTGLAAWQSEGVTLHSFAGMGLCQGDITPHLKKLLGNRQKLKEWRALQTLLVDEVSMLEADFLEKLARAARETRSSAEPFGGVQLVFLGDLAQCPPICKERQRRYFFEAAVWPSLQMRCVNLVENFRQAEDAPFRHLLARMRLARLLPEDGRLLRTRLISAHPEVDRASLLKLCSRRDTAERINNAEMARITGDSHHYESDYLQYDANGLALPSDSSSSGGQQQQKTFPVDGKLTLKLGVQVILCINLNPVNGLLNGSRGTVTSFRAAENGTILYPMVQFENGSSVLVLPYTWNTYKSGVLAESFTQVPLLMRYAMTIHRAQGLTLERVLITMDFFEPGQGYVAFSRVRHLSDLYVEQVEMRTIVADKAVIDFYNKYALL